MIRMRAGLALLATALGLTPIQAALAADAASCATVRMSDPGWTDITSTNALLGTVLDVLGYTQKIDTLSVPITYQSLKNQQIDAFLGSWQPAQASMLDPLKAAGEVEVLARNLSGIRFTLAVPTPVAEAGVRSVDDLAGHAEQFKSRIYGIDPGAAANNNIMKMIQAGGHGLGGWELIESSEQAMLAQVDRASRRKEWIVFLAWEPHPMNTKFPLTYLSGAEEVFGPNYGASDVYTLARKGFAETCPNLALLLKQTSFTVAMENEVMGAILDEGRDPKDAAAAWLKAHPGTVEPWLAGVTKLDGGDGLAAVKAALGS